MDLFSISQLSQFSGIKPHTIRIWEQRYNALKPNRSEGNTRYYDSSQLLRLLNIVSLMDSDYKVSELCSMPDKKLFELLEEWQEDNVSDTTAGYFVSQLIAAGMSYDEIHFKKILSHCLLRYGMKNVYLKVIYPMLNRIGLMWNIQSMPPANEHFISNLLRQKMFTAIDSLPSTNNESVTWMLFLPENEFHEIGLLFSNYLIRLSGRKVIYLGVNVPLQTLTAAVNKTLPNKLLFFLVHHNTPELVQAYLNKLDSGFAVEKIFVAGNQNLTSRLKAGKKINWVHSLEDLEQELLFTNV